MRALSLSLCLAVLTGCGSQGPEQPAGTSDQPAGVTLSVRNPEAQKKPAGALPSLSPEEHQAVEQLISAAQQAVDAGQTPHAIEALSQAIGVNPSDVRLFRMRADVYAMAGELASARADFSAAILAEPENAELRNLRGYFLMKCGVFDDALRDFAEALRLEPELAAAWNNRGLLYLQQSEYSKAEKEFRGAVECDPDYADGWNNLGFACMKQKKLEEALQHIDQSLELNPRYVTAWNNRGLIHLSNKDFEAACTAFTRAIELSDLDPRWYAHRQVALKELKRFDEAAADERTIAWISRLSHLNQDLNRDSQDAVRWIARAECLVEGEKYDAAVNDFTNALKLEPDNTAALNGRARVWTRTGEFGRAIDDCEQSIVIEPTMEAFALRGEAWLAMDNLDQAIADFEESHRFDEVFAETYRRRAEQRRSKGDTSGADADLEAAGRIEDALAGRLEIRDAEPIPFPDSE